MEKLLVDWKNFSVCPSGYKNISKTDRISLKRDIFRNRHIYKFNVWRQEGKDGEIYLLDNPISISILYELETEYPKEMPHTFEVNVVDGETVEEAMDILLHTQEERKEQEILDRFEINQTMDIKSLGINEENICTEIDNYELIETSLEVSVGDLKKVRCPNCGKQFSI